MTLTILTPLRLRHEAETWRMPVKTVDFNQALEGIARVALTSCATKVLVPPLPFGVRSQGGSYDISALSHTVRTRVQVVDKQDRTWKAIRTYFQPIVAELRALGLEQETEALARDIHLLALAAHHSSQVHIDLAKHIAFLKRFSAVAAYKLSSEVAARLALLGGTLGQLRETDTLPGFRITEGNALVLKDRFSEIIEDAYLAEAATMRRFLSFESNVASVRRDLRRLLRAISRERSWAKRVVEVAEQFASLPETTGIALKALTEVAKLTTVEQGPVVMNLRRDRTWAAYFRVGPGKLAWEMPIRTLDEHEVKRPYIAWATSTHFFTED